MISASGTSPASTDVEIDRAREPDGLFQPRRRRALAAPSAMRGGLRRPAAQIRADHHRAAGRRARSGRAQPVVELRGDVAPNQAFSAGASSAPSNSWIGCPGMMVEIACL